MTNELYHRWLRKGETADDHKYTRREWRNGHWVYYYDDGTTTKDYPKGQNYKTSDQVKQERAAAEAKKASDEAEKAAKKAVQQEINEKIDGFLDRLIEKGKSSAEKFERLMSSRVSDLPQTLEWLFEDDT